MTHLNREQLEQYRDGPLPAADLRAAGEHLDQCADCRAALAAITPAASKQVPQARSAKPAKAASTHHPVQPQPAQPRPEPSKLRAFFQSPQLVLMLAAGIVLVIGGPYLALRTLPDSGRDADDSRKDSKSVPLDASDLESLPQALAISAQAVLYAEQPEIPEALIDVPAPLGFAPTYPVTEVVESTRPTLAWDPGDLPPPYTVVLRNAAGQALVRVPNIANPVLVLPMALERSAIYTWELSFSDGTTEEASFVVMDEGELELWQSVRAQYPNSHLVLGLMAQHFGLLSIAETEFQQLAADNPNSEQATQLLNNVIALRE